MVVTFSALAAVAPQQFADNATMWGTIRDQFKQQMDDYHKQVLEPVNHESWQGSAASAAQQRVRRTSDRLTPTHTYLDTAQFLLNQAAAGIKTAKARCAKGIELCESATTPLTPNGTPDVYDRPPDNIYWDQPAVLSAMRAANMIYQSRAMADHVDSNVSRLLNNATKFNAETWAKDADADHQSARDFAKTMPDVLAEMAVDEGTWTDTPAQPYKVESHGVTDQTVYETLCTAPTYFAAHGWWNAGALLTHWLNNSGNTCFINPAAMMDEIPQFKSAVSDFVHSTGTDRLGRTQDGVTAFDSWWQNCAATDGDWYWALHDFRYRVVGISAVVNGKRTTDYTVGVLKPYVFGDSANGVKRTPIPLVPHTPIKLDQARIQHLHTTGLARNFIAHGTADFTG